MKTARKKRASVVLEPTTDTPALTTFSSDLLTPEEERELLAAFWDCKSELVRLLLRHYPLLRANRPPFEPWPMAQFIREFCTEDVVRETPSIRRIHEKYVHFKHRLASANIRLAAHVAKRFRHHALSYSDLLQEAVCGKSSLPSNRGRWPSSSVTTPTTKPAQAPPSAAYMTAMSTSSTASPRPTSASPPTSPSASATTR